MAVEREEVILFLPKLGRRGPLSLHPCVHALTDILSLIGADGEDLGGGDCLVHSISKQSHVVVLY